MKSFFTKLGKVLLCGVAVAVVGCTDYDTDIQNVNDRVDDLVSQVGNLDKSTAATIAELQAAITSLQTTQSQMAADYAKKSELEAAKTELQTTISGVVATVEASVKAATDAITALDANKADKTAVAELKAAAEKAIADATKAIAALDAAKADKTEVAAISSEVNLLKEGYQQMTAQFKNLQLVLEGKASQADLELVQADVKALKEGYAQTVTALTNILGSVEALEGRVEANEGDIKSLKDAAAQAILGITNLNGQVAALDARVETLEAEVKKIQTAIAQQTEALQNLAGRLEKAEGDIEDEVAARKAADKAIQDYVVLLNDGLTNLKFAYELHAAEMLEFKALAEKQIEELQAQDAALANAILSYYDQAIAAVETLKAEQVAALAALEAKIVAAWEKESALIYNTILNSVADLRNELNEQWAEELDEVTALIYNTILNNINDLRNELNEQWAENLDEELALVYNTILTNVADLRNELNEQWAENLDEQLALVYNTIRNTDLEIRNYVAEELAALAAIVDTLGQNVEDLLARVQSLVYVPEYSDHKATLDWAYITNPNGYIIAPKATALKYRVHAVAGEDAAKAAADLAAAWKLDNTIFEFDVENVKVRSNEAGLVIVDVTAKGENLIVSARAENFAENFYIANDVATNETVQVAKTSSYSAALILTDGNNNRSTEYTNLVPAVPFTLTTGLFLNDADETVEVSDKTIEYKMPCTDTETIKTAVQPVFGFIPTSEEVYAQLPSIQPYFTVEQLVAAGYDLKINKKSTIVTTANNKLISDYSKLSEKNRYNGWGVEFKWVEKLFVLDKTVPAVFDYNFSVAPNVKFDEVGKFATVTYTYNCGAAIETLTYKFILANAQVNVEMEAEKAWTVKLQAELWDGSKHYANELVIDSVKYEGIANLEAAFTGAAVITSTTSYTMDKDGKWVLGGPTFFVRDYYKDGSIKLVLGGGTYSWNNTYKIVWTSTNNVAHVDVTTTAVVTLSGRPDKVDVTVPVNYVLDGKKTYFAGKADIYTPLYAAMKDYLGYDEAWFKARFAYYTTKYEAGDYGLPVVNGKKGYSSNLLGLTEARLLIGGNIINEGKDNVTKITIEDWWQIPMNISVEGKIAVPSNELIYSTDYVREFDENGVGRVHVIGQVEDNVFSIVQADLAKYFNVDSELDGHKFTVDFETANTEVLIAPELTTDVEEANGATYNFLTQNNAVLKWHNYRGLEVKVKATLKVNGYPRNSLDLVLYTEDPLTLTGKKGTVEDGVVVVKVDRELRKDTEKVAVFKNLLMTSTAKGETKTNLIDVAKTNLADAFAYVKATYGGEVEIKMGLNNVYYKVGEEIVVVGTNKYDWNETNATIQIYGDDAEVEVYYADFYVTFSSRICGGAEVNANGKHVVPVQVRFTLKK